MKTTKVGRRSDSAADVELAVAVASSHSNSDFTAVISAGVGADSGSYGTHAAGSPITCLEVSETRLVDDIDRPTYAMFAVAGVIFHHSMCLSLYNILLFGALILVVVNDIMNYGLDNGLIKAVLLVPAASCQLVAIFMCAYKNSRRLAGKYRKLEKDIHSQLTPRTVVTSVLIAMFSCVPLGFIHQKQTFFLAVAAFTIVMVECLVFGANAQFLLVDATLSEQLVRALIIQQRSGKDISLFKGFRSRSTGN
jgi:hypothetical protein